MPSWTGIVQGWSWRKSLMAICFAASVGGFGSIIVRAADDSGVYDVARQYSNQRGAPRFQLPQVFRTAPPPRTQALSYAPVPTTGLRSDSFGKASPSTAKVVKVAPSPKSSAVSDEDFEESYLKSRTSYCVRRCDGFYFPVGNPDTGGVEAHAEACARACPGAETDLYIANAGSTGIDDAVTRRGARYNALPAAFAYRTQYDSACTCNGGPGRARNYSVMSDFTLRSGDMIMSREGLKVFRGEGTFPHRASAFTSANTAQLSAAERRWVQDSETASLRGMQGAKVSLSLQARIDAQVRAINASHARSVGLRGVERQVQVTDGRSLRYVGPDSQSVSQ